MRKCKLLMMLLLYVSVSMVCVPTVHAQETSYEESDIINPYTDTSWVSVSIKHSGTKITSTTLVSPYSKYTSVEGVMYVEKFSNGMWNTMKSWRIDKVGTVAMSGTYVGSAGSTYRTKIVINVGSDYIVKTSSSIRI